MGAEPCAPPAKWDGKVRVPVESVAPEEAWAVVSPFTNLNELLPVVETCGLEEGEPGKPGCVRKCITTVPLPPGTEAPTDPPKVSWAKERLLKADPDGRRIEYEVVESNMGFTGRFDAVLAVVGEACGEGGEGEGVVPVPEGGCVLEWSFSGDPVEGWTREELVGFFQAGAAAMATSIKEAAKCQMTPA